LSFRPRSRVISIPKGNSPPGKASVARQMPTGLGAL
jgi:hypothetical protein